jgi:hypothetical protein
MTVSSHTLSAGGLGFAVRFSPFGSELEPFSKL